MNDSDKIVLGLAFIIAVYGLALWLMRIALRPPTGFWASDRLADQSEDPLSASNPGPAGPTE